MSTRDVSDVKYWNDNVLSHTFAIFSLSFSAEYFFAINYLFTMMAFEIQ